MIQTPLPLMQIEGFYGRPWSHLDRIHVMRSLSSAGYSDYLYAPKSDAYLREKWQEFHPESCSHDILEFGNECCQLGIRFGLGLSPMGLHAQWDDRGREVLLSKIAQLQSLGMKFLALLFDDMRGDYTDLAQTQAEICHVVQQAFPDMPLYMCPSYYSFDPVLDLVFGHRPPNYLQDLGRFLDPAIQVFWTGNRVCSSQISVQDLIQVNEWLGRKVYLWDNEPVNDGVRMAPWLNLRAYPGRSAELAPHISGHGSNPMVEPRLSALVQGLLPLLYVQGTLSDADLDARLCAELPQDLAVQIIQDLELLRSRGVGMGNNPDQYMTWSRRILGLEGWNDLNAEQQKLLGDWQNQFETQIAQSMSDGQRQKLWEFYSVYDHPVAAEIAAFLQFKFAFDPNCLT